MAMRVDRGPGAQFQRDAEILGSRVSPSCYRIRSMRVDRGPGVQFRGLRRFYVLVCLLPAAVSDPCALIAVPERNLAGCGDSRFSCASFLPPSPIHAR